MAKFGNFIGKTDLPISTDEIEKWTNIFKKYISTNEHTKDFEIEVKYNENKELGIVNLQLKAKNPNEVASFRGFDESTINLTGINMLVYKEAGFIEKKSHDADGNLVIEKDETAECPEFNWNVYIRGIGSQREYRKKSWHDGVYLRNSFMYGSEFEDFNELSYESLVI